MELRSLLRKIWPIFKWYFIITVMLSVTVFILSYKLPHTFKASGLLFVSRQTDAVSPSYFTYEGYYSGQTAERYTDSVLGILKSLAVKKAALDSLKLPSDSISVNNFDDATLVQKTGPQLLSFTVSGKSTTEAKDLWKALASQTISAVGDLNRQGDERLTVQEVNVDPLMEEVAPKPWLYGLAVLIGLGLLGLVGLSTWVYLKD